MIYTLRKTRSGYEGPINKRLIGTFESHRALMRWLRQQADKRGYGRKRTLFLADGSEHIWREKARFGSSSTVSPTCGAKCRTQAQAPRPSASGSTTSLSTLVNMPTTCATIAFGKTGLDIGTGAVEGAVRNVNVIAMRLDGPGMRWGRERSELVLQLRCILVSGQWNDFVDYLARGTSRCGLNRSRPRSMRQRLENQELHPPTTAAMDSCTFNFFENFEGIPQGFG